MTPSHVREVQVRPIIQILKDTIAKYGWWVTRWAIDWKGKDGPYIFAYMAFPRGYVLHESSTVEHPESGLRAQLIVFREEGLADPRKAVHIAPTPAMQPGGYL